MILRELVCGTADVAGHRVGSSGQLQRDLLIVRRMEAGLLGLSLRDGLPTGGSRLPELGGLTAQSGQLLGVPPVDLALDEGQVLAHLPQPPTHTTRCALEQLHRALNRRDGDPRTPGPDAIAD